MKAKKAKYIFDGENLYENMAVVTKDNTVLDFGLPNVIKKVYGIDIEDLGEGVLFGGFVNLHTHLELSYMKNSMPQYKGFVSWLEAVIKTKKENVDKQFVLKAIQNAVETMQKSGVVAVGDISNTLDSCDYLKEYMPESVLFFENYALNRERACLVKDELENTLDDKMKGCMPLTLAPTAHSIYSTNGCLINYLANAKPNLPFSIHFLESRHEREFLRSKGELFELLDGFGLIDQKLNYNSVFDYLKDIGALRSSSIFVHCVDIKDSELDIIKNLNSTVCLCPRSNKYISNTLSDIYKIAKSGVNIGIGTDSLASNWDLDILNEMRLIFREFDKIDPKTIFKWATVGGAEALGIKLGVQKDFRFYDVFLKTDSNSPLEEILDK